MADFIFRLVLPLLLFLGFTGCRTAGEERPADPTRITLQEEAVLVDLSAPGDQEPILGDIDKLAAGPGGRIYLYDGESQRIALYDSSGNYLNSFGREGAGPGEFRTLAFLLPLGGGEVAASDRGNAAISLFGRKGELLLSATSLGISSVRSMDRLPDGRFLLAGWHPDSRMMLHVADAGLSTIQASFLPGDALPPAEHSRLSGLARDMAGYVKAVGPGRVAFAPAFYDGRIFHFEEGRGGTWQPADTSRMIKTLENPLRFSSHSARSALERYPLPGILSVGSSGEGGVNVVHTLSRSYGLYLDNRGRLVHLSCLFLDNTVALMIERFDPVSGELLDSGQTQLGRDTPYRPLAIDHRGRLLLEHTDSSRVLRMSINRNL